MSHYRTRYHDCCRPGGYLRPSGLTALSTPLTKPSTAAMRCTSSSADRDERAYQCPMLSRYTRTLDGSEGNSRDHTTGMDSLPARHKRPSFTANPTKPWLPPSI